MMTSGLMKILELVFLSYQVGDVYGIRPRHGFKPEIIDELTEKIKLFSEKEKFVVLLFDEMKIQDSSWCGISILEI